MNRDSGDRTCRLVAIGLIVLCSLPQISSGEGTSKRFTIPRHGTLELAVPPGWRDEVRQPERELPPTIVFWPPEGEGFEVLISALWSPSGDPDFNSSSNLLWAAEFARDRAAPSAMEESIAIQKLRGEHCSGYYFSVTDRAPKPGEYRFMTHGSVAIDDLLLTFTVLSNDRKLRAAKATLEMLRTANKASD